MSVYGDFGTVQIGRLTLREALAIASEIGSSTTTPPRTMKLTGQEAVPALTTTQLAAVQDDLPGLIGPLTPVQFTNKTDRNGYWQVTDVQSDLMNWNGELVTATWQMTMTRVGTDTEIDLESRLTGSATRVNSFSATGERTHCPPVGHYAYYSGTTTPSVLVRTGSDGAMQVYRGLDTTTNPRWGCHVETYLLGRVRFLDANDIERTGTTYSVRPMIGALTPSTTLVPSPSLLPESGAANHWTLHNTLVKVAPSTSAGVLMVSAYTTAGWQDKTWDIQIGGVSIGVPDTVTVLRNEPEIVVVRLLHAMQPGRATIDLTLRRGSRFVEIYVQAETATTLAVVRPSTEAGTSGTGYVTASTDDGAGNRYIVGSAKTFTADTTHGGVSLSNATALDCFVGAVVGGHDAQTGDDAVSLFKAYLGQPSELIQAVRR